MLHGLDVLSVVTGCPLQRKLGCQSSCKLFAFTNLLSSYVCVSEWWNFRHYGCIQSCVSIWFQLARMNSPRQLVILNWARSLRARKDRSSVWHPLREWRGVQESKSLCPRSFQSWWCVAWCGISLDENIHRQISWRNVGNNQSRRITT